MRVAKSVLCLQVQGRPGYEICIKGHCQVKNTGQNSKSFTAYLFSSLLGKLLWKSMGILPEQRTRNVILKTSKQNMYYKKVGLLKIQKNATILKSNALLMIMQLVRFMHSLGLDCKNKCLVFFTLVPFCSTFDKMLLLCVSYQCFFIKRIKTKFLLKKK